MRENTQYITLTAKTFETDVLKSPEPVLVNFGLIGVAPVT